MANPMDTKRPDDQYTEQEARQRFEKLVKAALNTKPKPLAEMKRNPQAKRPGPQKKTSRKVD